MCYNYEISNYLDLHYNIIYSVAYKGGTQLEPELVVVEEGGELQTQEGEAGLPNNKEGK